MRRRPATQDDLVSAVVAEGITDPRLIAAFRTVPRASFVPPELVERAYEDEPLPIPHAQVTTQPSLVARMVEALALTGSERVLEIGTGYGFQTALLARLARVVWSVERWADVAQTARANLANEGIQNAEVVVNDGSVGLSEESPFEAILVAAAFPVVPRALVEQLALGGRLVQPIGSGGDEEVVLFENAADGFERRQTVTWARFVRLYGAHGFPFDER